MHQAVEKEADVPDKVVRAVEEEDTDKVVRSENEVAAGTFSCKYRTYLSKL